MKTAAFFALSLFIALFLSLGSSAEQLQKRHCSTYKRNVLDKRNYYEKKCKCSVAQASFTGESNYVGFNSFFQNECGETQIFGQYTGGFFKGVNYSFAIVDDCGNQLFDLKDMNIVVNDFGGTEPFSNLFPNINLNCDSNGLQFTKSAVSKRKRNNYCKPTYRKRAPGDGGAYMQIQPNNGQAALSYP